jgi:membrane-bound lytic murein transglycosylase F
MQPNDLNHKDRLSLALAAYNIGIAHLRDAQGLAEEKGLNPHSWQDLKKVLPKLAEPKYYTQLRYGKARGYETVAFVDRVKSFYNILSFTQR